MVLPNDFPYSTEPGVEHVLIWSKQPLSAEFIESVLEEKYGSSVLEWIYFVNPPEYQSVRRLPHAHVFMRKRHLEVKRYNKIKLRKEKYKKE